jgi:hypothetical protein
MRVGAAGETVLGTIHGEDPTAVRERVVTDLGVTRSSFASTDLLVVLDDRRVETLVEVTDHGDEVGFDALFDRTADGLASTGRIDRGESRLVDGLAGAGESYADVREAIDRREERIRTAATTGRTTPDRYAGWGR